MTNTNVTDAMLIEACTVFYQGSWTFVEAEMMRAALEAAFKVQSSVNLQGNLSERLNARTRTNGYRRSAQARTTGQGTQAVIRTWALNKARKIMASRPPDFVTGAPNRPAIQRWYLIKPNRWFNLWLHNIVGSDDDRAPHDHSWHNLTWVLETGYIELVKEKFVGLVGRGRVPGNLIFRHAQTAHRIIVLAKPAVTLFATGPTIRDWGFHCPQGWINHKRFLDPVEGQKLSLGCGVVMWKNPDVEETIKTL